MSPEEEEGLEVLKRQARLERAQETQREQAAARGPAQHGKGPLMPRVLLGAVIAVGIVVLAAWGFRSIVTGYHQASNQIQAQHSNAP